MILVEIHVKITSKQGWMVLEAPPFLNTRISPLIVESLDQRSNHKRYSLGWLLFPFIPGICVVLTIK